MTQSIGEFANSPEGKAALAKFGAGNGPAQALVYLGTTGRYVGSMFESSDKRVSVDAAKMDIYSWSDEERAQWGKRLYGAGVIEDPADWAGMTKAWSYAVDQTAGFNAGGKPNMTPWSFIDLLEQQGAFDKNLEERKKATEPRTSTSTSINAIPTRSDADAAIKTLFREQLGRDPEDGELDRYASMMLSKMRANPGSSTTVSTTDPVTGNSTSRSTSVGGFNPTSMLEDKVKADPEWGAYQAATTYFNALQGALGAPGGA